MFCGLKVVRSVICMVGLLDDGWVGSRLRAVRSRVQEGRYLELS